MRKKEIKYLEKFIVVDIKKLKTKKLLHLLYEAKIKILLGFNIGSNK